MNYRSSSNYFFLQEISSSYDWDYVGNFGNNIASPTEVSPAHWANGSTFHTVSGNDTIILKRMWWCNTLREDIGLPGHV